MWAIGPRGVSFWQSPCTYLCFARTSLVCHRVGPIMEVVETWNRDEANINVRPCQVSIPTRSSQFGEEKSKGRCFGEIKGENKTLKPHTSLHNSTCLHRVPRVDSRQRAALPQPPCIWNNPIPSFNAYNNRLGIKCLKWYQYQDEDASMLRWATNVSTNASDTVLNMLRAQHGFSKLNSNKLWMFNPSSTVILDAGLLDVE